MQAAAAVVVRFLLVDAAAAAVFSRCRCCFPYLLMLCVGAGCVARRSKMVIFSSFVVSVLYRYFILKSAGHISIEAINTNWLQQQAQQCLVARFRDTLVFGPAPSVAATGVSAPPNCTSAAAVLVGGLR